MNNNTQINIKCRNCDKIFTATYNFNLPLSNPTTDLLGNTVYTDAFNNKILINPKGQKSISFKCEHCGSKNTTSTDTL